GSLRQFVDLPEDAVGKRYKLQTWIKTEDISTGGQVYLRYQILRESDGTRIGAIINIPSTLVKVTTDWTLYEHTFTAPNEAYRLNIEGCLEFGTGTAWFDDIQLFEVDASGNPIRPAPEPVLDPGNLVSNGKFENVDGS